MAKINIAGELDCKTTEGKLVDASQVKDITRDNKSQKEINDNIFKSLENPVLPNIDTALDTDAIIITIDNENGEKSTTIPTATTEKAGVMSAADKKALNNPLGLSTTIGIEEFIAFCLPDSASHEIGVQQITFSNGFFKMFDATLNIAIGFTDGGLAVDNPTGIREYWQKVAHDGQYYVYYARINWDAAVQVTFSTPNEKFIVPSYPTAYSVAGSSLLNMLQSLDYDIAGVTKSNDNGIAKELSVVWRDGTPGTVTYSDYRADVLEYGTLAVTYDKNEDPEKNHVKVVQVREYSEMGDVVKRTTTIKYKYA